MSTDEPEALPPGSDLLRACIEPSSAAGVALLFGGQGYTYFAELQAQWADPAARPALATIAAALTDELASAEGTKSSKNWPLGLDLVGWLEDAAQQPPISYLCSAPVSYPLIYACQLVNYVAMLQRTGLSHSELLPAVKGATGHSQGVVAAAVVASAASDEELLAKAALGARYAR